MKFNIGEWSELFVVASIFNNNRIKIAHSYNYIKVIKIYFKNKKLVYMISEMDINKDNVKVYPLYTSQELFGFLDELSKSTGASFSLTKGNQFIGKYDIPVVKETGNKGDIDTNTIFPNETYGRNVNFSIKSFIGNLPTLINSSQATNFIFEIKGFIGDLIKINSISTKSKIKDRLHRIRSQSTFIEIIAVENNVFHDNMLKIDTNFLKMIAPILLNFYSSKLSSVVDLVENTVLDDYSKDIIKLNVKRFLRAFALGMTPKKPWNGDNVTGGSIVVERTGDLSAYTLYDMKKYDDFLYENCKFDTPSSSRHKFGKVYQEESRYYIKLNLQIRFK